MRRGDFEDLVRRYLDSEVGSRGFRLIPQPPAEWEDEKPQAVYEADPNDFGERYPALDERVGGNVMCVDLWIHLDPGIPSISGDLDGTSIEQLEERFGLRSPKGLGSDPTGVETQLKELARRIAMALDAARGN